MVRKKGRGPAVRLAIAGTVSVNAVRGGWVVKLSPRLGDGDGDCVGDCKAVIDMDMDEDKCQVYCQDDDDDPCESPCECHLIDTWKDKDKKGKNRKHRKDWGPVPKTKPNKWKRNHTYTCECHPNAAGK